MHQCNGGLSEYHRRHQMIRHAHGMRRLGRAPGIGPWPELRMRRPIVVESLASLAMMGLVTVLQPGGKCHLLIIMMICLFCFSKVTGIMHRPIFETELAEAAHH